MEIDPHYYYFSSQPKKEHAYAFIRSFPQNGSKVDSSDGWGEVCTDSLYVNVHLSSLHALNHRYPHHTNNHHYHHKYSTFRTKDAHLA